VLGGWLKDGKFEPALYDSEHDALDDGASEGVREIEPNCVVSADTPLLEMLRSPPPGLRESGIFVIEGSSFSGVISEGDLLSDITQPCLLALALQLELSALNLCRLFPKECLAALPPERRKKAIANLEHKLH